MIVEIFTGIVGFFGGTYYGRQASASEEKKRMDKIVSSYTATIENLKRKSDADDQRIQKLSDELSSFRKKYNSSDSDLMDLEDENKLLKVNKKKMQQEIDRLNDLCKEYQLACDSKDAEISSLRNK